MILAEAEGKNIKISYFLKRTCFCTHPWCHRTSPCVFVVECTWQTYQIDHADFLIYTVQVYHIYQCQRRLQGKDSVFTAELNMALPDTANKSSGQIGLTFQIQFTFYNRFILKFVFFFRKWIINDFNE